MNYIVMDLEWNQGSPEMEAEKEEIPFEIVEIGAVKLNNERVMIDQFSELVRPQVYAELHHITRKLIHMQMEELQKGEVFPVVCQNFLDWIGKEPYMFCSWGPLDLMELQRNMRYYHMPPLADRPIAFLDVQKLFSIAFEDSKSRKALEYAVDFLQIEKDIPFHRAFSDAYYTAKVLSKIKQKAVLQYVSFDTYVKPDCEAKEVHIDFDGYSKYISRTFPDKLLAMDDREISSCNCNICKKKVRKKLKWFTPNGKHYYAVGYCDKHGYIKSKVRIRKAEHDQVFCIKTESVITEPEVLELKALQERVKMQKKERKRRMNS